MAFTSFLAGTQNANQFNQAALPGSLDLQSNPNPEVLTCRLNPAAISAYPNGIPGAVPVKLADLGGADTDGVPYVDVADALADTPFGVSISNTKQGYTKPGDVLQVAMVGAIIRMGAKAAINRGLTVVTDTSVGGLVQTSVGKTGKILALTMDKATASNQLIRVKIIANGTTFAGSVSS